MAFALQHLASTAVMAAESMKSYSYVANQSVNEYGEGITREGVNKCSRKHRRKRRGKERCKNG